jgi:hypothetical protein
MTLYIRHKAGQSIYDLCNEAYGSLDNLVEFCRANNVTDMQSIPQLVDYAYESELVKYDGSRKPFASAYIAPTTCPVITGISATDISGVSATLSWASSLVGSYEYAYNTTGDEPTVWIGTTANSRVLSGLSDHTLYYFFVRSVCAPGLYSSPAFTTFTTAFVAPAPPYPEFIIASHFSDVNLTLSGSDVDEWGDDSGTGNDLFCGASKPLLVNNVLNGYPAVRFYTGVGSRALATSGDLIGLDGEAACSLFMVCQFASPASSMALAQSCVNPAAPVSGEFRFDLQRPGGTIQLLNTMRGNVGNSIGYNTGLADTPALYDVDMDYSKTDTAEMKVYKNNSLADYTQLVTSENTSTFVAAPYTIGVANVDIVCVVVYKRSLDNTQRAAVANYLMTRYGL